MGKARAEIDIDRPADDVWAVVGDFGGIAGWMPGIESCEVDGDDRIIKIMGMEVTERLERRDEDAREIVYAIVGGVPVANHKATITVVPDGTSVARHVGRGGRRRDDRHDAPDVPTEPAGPEGPPVGLTVTRALRIRGLGPVGRARSRRSGRSSARRRAGRSGRG